MQPCPTRTGFFLAQYHRLRSQNVNKLMNATIKMNKITTIPIYSILMLFALIACTQPKFEPSVTDKENNYESITVVDSRNQEIVFESPPQRIISLSPAHTEIFYELGLDDNLVGTDTFSDFPSDARIKPKVGDAFNINLEAIAELEPDLVYTTFETPVTALEDMGVKVLYLFAAADIQGVIENIKLIGSITNKTDQAETMATSMERKIEDIRFRLSNTGIEERIYYELDPGLYTAGPESFIGDILGLLKTHNISQGISNPYPKLSQEIIIESDPTIIILGDSIEYLTTGVTVQQVKDRPSWHNISAIRNDRIYPFNDSLISRPGPRIIEGINQLALLIHPKLFPDFIK